MDRKESVLIVDDEIGPRESLRMILKLTYDVHTVENGQDAIKFILKTDADLITLDLNMPGMSGIETLQKLKKLKPDVKVIIITGYGTLNNAQDAIRFGAEDFISKPYNVSDVTAVVSKAFERRKSELKIKNLKIQGIERQRSVQGQGNI